MKQYATYLRVSTQKQGRSGLGLESQQKICNDFIKANCGEKCAEFKDVESGTHRDRKGLWNAIEYCKSNNCPLVIAKLDRLARDVEFCFHVINTGIEIHFCDMPAINSLLLGVFASVAQYERELTSDRTKKALAAKKERGEATGGACKKWRESYNNKSKEERKKEQMEKGKMKRERHHQSRDIQTFAKVIKKTFPYHCEGDDITKWEWMGITCRRVYIEQMLERMAEYKEIDPTLFRNFKFEDGVDANAQKMRSYMQAFKKSFGIVI
jgi:DNA invertase Pin-like site-specific DNA recombinase